jgi:hypothetical protein
VNLAPLANSDEILRENKSALINAEMDKKLQLQLSKMHQNIDTVNHYFAIFKKSYLFESPCTYEYSSIL